MKILRFLIWPAAWVPALLLTFSVAARAQDRPRTVYMERPLTIRGGGPEGQESANLPPPEKSPSMVPVHVGVGIMAMGHFSDWATSWKQPEGNPWLSQSSGPYTGQLYRTGTYRKAGTVAGLAGVSYLVAWRWPKARKYIGWIDGGIGVAVFGIAVSNVIRSPYYQ